jgi:replicative DNA helicase Mcm
MNTDQSQFIDAQQLRVQESYAGLRGGEDPQYVDVTLEDDVAGTVTAGEQVTVTGILKLDQRAAGRQQSSQFDVYLDGVSLVTDTDAYAEVTFSDETKEAIVSHSAEPDIYDQLIDSIAPSVHDNETIKLGILLQLFGGMDKEFPDGARSRGNIHMLLLGPSNGTVDRLVGLGTNVAPRAVSISGTETTAAGLTAAATTSSDAPGDDPWTLKAGAMVMADNGLLGLHGVDALSSDALAALGRTMDAQEVHVSKASQTQSLPANTAVLAAGTPPSGGFDQYRPLGQQIGITPQLVSQFDLVFTITDDDVDDEAVADHLIEVARAAEGAIGMEHSTPPKPKSETSSFPATDEFAPPVEADLLRQYAVYARQHCFPAITEAAKERLIEFYVQARTEQSEKRGPLSVTEQTLESLIRLTEASARIRLAEMAEIADAERAIEVMEASLEHIGAVVDSDDLDAETVVSGDTEEFSDEELLLSVITELESSEHGANQEQVLAAGRENGLSETEAQQALTNLKQRGKAYEPKEGELRST